jgi:hypothetical protein
LALDRQFDKKLLLRGDLQGARDTLDKMSDLMPYIGDASIGLGKCKFYVLSGRKLDHRVMSPSALGKIGGIGNRYLS